MGDKSAIQWTDATWNIARGCTKVDEDCKYCYMYRDSFDSSRLHPLVDIILRKEEPIEEYDDNNPYHCFLVMKRAHDDTLHLLFRDLATVDKLGAEGAYMWLVKNPKADDEKAAMYLKMYKNSLLYLEKIIYDHK